MKKKYLVLWTLSTIILLLTITIPSAAGNGGWSKRVTGGMTDSVANFPLIFSINARENFDGTFGGQGQFYIVGAKYHLKVTKLCTGVVPPGYEYTGHEYVVVIGELFGQDGTEVDEGYGGISIVEGGSSKSDAVRWAFDRQHSTMRIFCDDVFLAPSYYSFTFEVQNGNFNIRSR